MSNDEQLKQRIQYLIQHGGLLDDPLADIRRRTFMAVALGASSLVFDLSILVLLLR